MKRPGTLRLAIMGGGAVLAIGGGIALLPGETDACRTARAIGSPDAATLCRSSGSSHSSSSTTSHYGGGSSTATAASAGADSTSVSRGGFGSSAHASSGS